MNKVEFEDHSEEVLEEMENTVTRVLETCGLVAEGYAKRLAPVDTGSLRNSISHKVDTGGGVVYIGTNVEYAVYVEMGTGKYVDGGRPTPWLYQDDNWNWHWTAGNPAKPFLAPAVKDHAREYRNIIEEGLKGG